MIKFITDYPALFISDIKCLVVADLHLGIEHELYQSGIVISPQAEKFQKIVDKLAKMTKAKKLVILGDIKHKVPGTSFRELKEVPKFLKHVSSKLEVLIAKGNHDDFIEKIVPKRVKVQGSHGFRIGSYGFFHGHAWPAEELMECDHLLMGHVHPAVEFKDSFSYRIVEPVWLKDDLNKKLVMKSYDLKSKNKIGELEMIVLPCFNPILFGIALNAPFKMDYMGPIITNKIFDVKKSIAHMIDGTRLGRIRDLKNL